MQAPRCVFVHLNLRTYNGSATWLLVRSVKGVMLSTFAVDNLTDPFLPIPSRLMVRCSLQRRQSVRIVRNNAIPAAHAAGAVLCRGFEHRSASKIQLTVIYTAVAQGIRIGQVALST